MTRSTAVLLLFIAMMILAGLTSCSSTAAQAHTTHDSVPKTPAYPRDVLFRAADTHGIVYIVSVDSAFRKGDLIQLSDSNQWVILQERVK